MGDGPEDLERQYIQINNSVSANVCEGVGMVRRADLQRRSALRIPVESFPRYELLMHV
jgi:hypothetical protein